MTTYIDNYTYLPQRQVDPAAAKIALIICLAIVFAAIIALAIDLIVRHANGKGSGSHIIEATSTTSQNQHLGSYTSMTPPRSTGYTTIRQVNDGKNDIHITNHLSQPIPHLLSNGSLHLNPHPANLNYTNIIHVNNGRNDTVIRNNHIQGKTAFPGQFQSHTQVPKQNQHHGHRDNNIHGIPTQIGNAHITKVTGYRPNVHGFVNR